MTACVNCESYNTTRVHTERADGDTRIEVYVCEECPAEFEVVFSRWDARLTDMGETMVARNE